jgi:hypothetical protein
MSAKSNWKKKKVRRESDSNTNHWPTRQQSGKGSGACFYFLFFNRIYFFIFLFFLLYSFI